MAQSGCLDEEVDSYPPPIPRRNPLRDNTRYQAKRRPTVVRNHNNGNLQSSALISGALTETSLVSNNQQQLVANPFMPAYHLTSRDNEPPTTAIIEEANVDVGKYSGKTVKTAPTRQVGDTASLANTKSSLTDALKRYSAFLNHDDTPILKSDCESENRQREIEEAMARLRRSLDETDIFTSISSNNGDTSTTTHGDQQDEDARVETWLQLAANKAQAPESECASDLSKATTRPHALNIFPPTSPVTGRREYATSLSPMNNGRDAYGNFISTNTQDYFAVPPSQSSTKLKSVVEDATEPSTNSVLNLRGGGGWWNPLGVSQIEKQTASTERSLQRQEKEGQNLHTLRAAPRVPASSHGQSSVRVDDNWSDITDNNNDSVRPQVSRQWQPSIDAQFGSVQNRRKDNFRTSPPSSPIPHGPTHTQKNTAFGQPNTAASSGQRPSRTRDVADNFDDFDSGPKMLFSPRPRSPLSEFSFSPRTQKRWHPESTTRSPPQSPLPLPPAPKAINPASNINRHVGAPSIRKYWQERPQSTAESYDKLACKLQSLQLGESVSVTGWTPERDAPGTTTRPLDYIRPQNFDAQQREAQIRFRPKCQDIMMRYNAESSMDRRALQFGEMSLDTYHRQTEYLVMNINNSLQHSADESGYVILRDEFSILEAMSTPDGYAIYHDMLHTTNPMLWKSLEQQYRLAQTMQNPVPMPKSRESSLKSARKVGGKIARFILAAPSDPNLKTYSSRRKSASLDGFLTASSMAMPWMDPMTAAAYTGPNEEGAIEEPPRSKQGKASASVINDRIARYDFASSAAPPTRLTGTTYVPPKSRTLVSFNPSFNAYHPTPSTVAEQSTWPEGDSEGNLRVGKRPVLRGGAAGKSKKQRRKEEWLDLTFGWEKPGKVGKKRETREMKKQAWLVNVMFGKGNEWGIKL